MPPEQPESPTATTIPARRMPRSERRCPPRSGGPLGRTVAMIHLAASILVAAAASSPAGWQTIYEGDLTQGRVISDWIPVSGDWALTSEGMKKTGGSPEGLLMLRVPVVKGAVRIDYEAKCDGPPGDLSLHLGLRDLDVGGCAVFGFGVRAKATNTIQVPGMPQTTAKGPGASPGQWHKVTVLREGGRLTLEADGVTFASVDDVRGGYPGPYIGLSCGREGVFRRVTVRRRSDPELRAHLSPEAMERESSLPEDKFSLQNFSRRAVLKEAQRDELRYAHMDVQVRITTERQPVHRERDSAVGWGTVTKTPLGDLVVAFTGGREADEDPHGAVRFIRSSTGGRSWSEPVTVADSPLGDREAGIVALKSGALLITWRTSVGLEALGTLERGGSIDLARGVLVPANAPVRMEANGILSEASPADLARWKAHQAGFTESDLNQHIGSWCALSMDGGKTWGPRLPTPVHSPHGPAVLKDGRLMYLGRTVIDGKPFLATAESSDEGRSWRIVWKQPLHDDELLGLRDPHAVQCPDGRIVAVFRIAPTGWKRRGGEHALQCYVPNKIWQIESRDDGRTWTRPRITPMWGYPPHLTVLDDGRLLCTYGYRHTFYPMSQKACVSHDGGTNWDFEHEITLRGDTPDLHPGFPSSVESGDGWITTLCSQNADPTQRPGIERSRWQIPPRPRPMKEPSRLRVDFADPVLVAEGPLDERRWGFYQFPGYRLSPKGTLVGGYQTADDSAGGGASYENKKYCSRDGGKTWVPETEEDRTERESTPGFVTKDGTWLDYAGFKTLRPRELGLRPLGLPPAQGAPNAEFYRYSDLPPGLRVLRMKRRAPGGPQEEFEAPLEFPELGMVRHKVGQNSEIGLVALDAPLTPIYVRWGSRDYICELPDGTLLNLAGANILPRSGATAPHMATCLLASTDRGRSWKYRSTIMGLNPQQSWEGTEEASIVRRPNGTLVCVVRVEGQTAGTTANLWITRSTDEGRSWEAPERLNVHTAMPGLIALENGVVACLHGRPGISLRFSNDPDCRVWSEPHVLHRPIGLHYTNTGWQDSTCGYTSLVPLGPDRFLVVYSDFYHRDVNWTLHKAILAREVRVWAN